MMLKFWGMNLKLFYRNKLYRNTLSGLCFALAFVSIFFMKNGADFPFMFYLLVRFNFYFMLIFCTIAFLFSREDKSSNLVDCLDVIDNKKQSFVINNFLVLLMLLVIFNVFLMIMLVIIAYFNDQVSLCMECILSYYPMNVFLPQLSSLIITCIISRVKNNTISIVSFVIFIILISPYMEWFQWSTKPLVPIDQVINFIHKPFSFYYQNGSWSIDHLYGYQNEFYKIMIFIFWFVLALFLLIKYFVKKRISIIIGICALLSIFTTIYLPQSTCRINTKWDDTYSDINYYKVFDEKAATIYHPEIPIDYNIDEYSLDIKIKNKLFVEGTIKLSSSNNNDEFKLTLYHGYKLDSIENSNLSSYKQDGDYISLKFNKPIQCEELKIKYSGYHPNLYSNNQAVQLPGYFPWYPMPGNKQIYFSYGNTKIANYGYNPYNRVQSKYKINIDADYPIVTNLSRIKENIYEGNSDSLTLIGGFLKTDEDRFCNYFPLYLSNELNYDKYNQMRNENWDMIQEKVNEIFGIDLKIKNKKVIVLSNGIGRISNIGNYAEFNDYVVIANDGFISDTDFLMYYAFKNNNISYDLRDSIVLLGINYNRKELLEQIQNNLTDEAEKKDLEEEINLLGIEGYFKNIGKSIWK